MSENTIEWNEEYTENHLAIGDEVSRYGRTFVITMWIYKVDSDEIHYEAMEYEKWIKANTIESNG